MLGLTYVKFSTFPSSSFFGFLLSHMNFDQEIGTQLFRKLYQVLKFDSLNGRTCLHYAAYYGHSDCLQAILSSAKSGHVAASWSVSFANQKLSLFTRS